MKIMFVDVSLEGHHRIYLEAILSNCEEEVFVVLPEPAEGLECRQILVKNRDFANWGINDYLEWLVELKHIADNEMPDIIHFLYGDLFCKFFGLGLNRFKKYKTVTTFHWQRPDFLHRMSLKVLTRLFDKNIVHTEYLYNNMNTNNSASIEHIEYPIFQKYIDIDKNSARKALGIADIKGKVLLFYGILSQYKGLDILLEALMEVKEDFFLIIAGKEQFYTKQFIDERTSGYKEKVKCILKYLTEEEVGVCMQAADMIVLPYRHIFNGASGPLGEATQYLKPIIGSNHGSMGDIISKKHLGYTFETDNVEELERVLDKALSEEFMYDDEALAYKNMLDVEIFKNKYYYVYEQLNNEVR